MRRLLMAIILVSMAPVSAGASDHVETVRIVVPTREVAPKNAAPGVTSDRVGWVRVELPLFVSPERTLGLARARFGPEAILERHYSLLGPEDEPLFTQQWGLENTGQTGGVPDADIDAATSWVYTSGAGVVVAVIDSGIDFTHPDLVAQNWENPGETVNGVDDDNNGLVDDVTGWDTVDEDANPIPEGAASTNAHGTMVAGVIGASANGIGITGVAPEVKMMNLRACENNTCWSLDVAEAIYHAANEGADVINLSLGEADTEDPLMEGAIEYARQKGVVVIAAAGNASENNDALPGGLIMIPASLPIDNIIAVGASDDRDSKTGTSNFGAVSVDLFAPGEQIVTTATLDFPQYVLGGGTSFASAFVAGAAAQLISLDPSAGYREIVARVTGFADNPASLDGLSRFGRLNAGRTMSRRFIDTTGSVFVNAIDWIESRAITQGCNPPENHRYCPADHVTRGEMAVFFARAFSLPMAVDDHFADDAGRFYEGAANRMFEATVTVGCGSGRYCGDRLITREELAAMLARVLSLPATSYDRFVDDAGSIFEGAINKIAEAGITNGCNPPTNDRFCPTDRVTRGEMAAFIKRAVDYVAG